MTYSCCVMHIGHSLNIKLYLYYTGREINRTRSTAYRVPDRTQHERIICLYIIYVFSLVYLYGTRALLSLSNRHRHGAINNDGFIIIIYYLFPRNHRWAGPRRTSRNNTIMIIIITPNNNSWYYRPVTVRCVFRNGRACAQPRWKCFNTPTSVYLYTYYNIIIERYTISYIIHCVCVTKRENHNAHCRRPTETLLLHLGRSHAV